MQLQFVEPRQIHGSSILLEGSEAQHVVKVLRHRVGDTIVCTDGTGRFLHAEIDRVEGRKLLHAKIVRTERDPREEGAPWSTVGLALLKGDHFELALEKMVEVGVHRVVPLIARHNVVKWKPSGAARKIERWQRIADAATKQSGRSWRVEVTAPRTLDEALGIDDGATVVVADETETQQTVAALSLEPGRPHLGLVGPEGGFSEDERAFLAEHGARTVTLGPFRLRAETAAIVLATALNEGRRR